MEKMNGLLKEKTKCLILECLLKNDLSFSELLTHTGLRDHGQLNYHLKLLRTHGLIEKKEKYTVTLLGKRMGVYINQFQLKEMYPISVVCPLIQNERGEFLLVQRSTEPYKGYWVFPGGKIANGETIEQAAQREVREETGLTITLHRVIGFYPSIIYQEGELSFHANLIPILTNCIDSSEKVTISDEHLAYKFIHPRDFGKYDIVPVNDQIVKDLQQEGFQFRETVVEN